jgi:excisionase family DNA binding protein
VHDKLLTIREAAGLLALKEKTLYQWRWRKTGLPFVKVGRSLRVSERALRAFIERRTVYPQ